MNWGRGLYLAIVIFIVGMLTMVYIAFGQSNEMLEDNYYERELVYQNVINARTNLKPYLHSLSIKDTGVSILIKLPQEISQNMTKGTIQLIKMDDQKKDIHHVISQSEYSLSDFKLEPGSYLVKLNWLDKGVAYYYEKEHDFFNR